MKILRLILLVLSVSGCKHRGTQVTTASNESQWTVSGWYIRPEIEDQKGDHWELSKRLGIRINTSADERSFEQAVAYLKGFDKYLAKRTDRELFDMLATTKRNYNNAEYPVACRGNEMILDEIWRRYDRGLMVLPREEDYKDIGLYTGDSGPSITISDIIHGLPIRKKNRSTGTPTE
jgi:hypothetical protein